MAKPETQVEIGTATLDVTAREPEGDERKEVCERQKSLTPVFADYGEKTKDIRPISVVLLERAFLTCSPGPIVVLPRWVAVQVRHDRATVPKHQKPRPVI
jgi:hypothetical protein